VHVNDSVRLLCVSACLCARSRSKTRQVSQTATHFRIALCRGAVFVGDHRSDSLTISYLLTFEIEPCFAITSFFRHRVRRDLAHFFVDDVCGKTFYCCSKHLEFTLIYVQFIPFVISSCTASPGERLLHVSRERESLFARKKTHMADVNLLAANIFVGNESS